MTTPTNLQRIALDFTGACEGGFVDDPVDPGGATKYGVSLRFLRGLGPVQGDVDGDGDVDADDVKALTKQQAETLFLQHFWQPGYDSLAAEVAIRVFDHGVNAGKKAAVRLLQQACRAHGARLDEDGVLGPRTIVVASSHGIYLLPTYRAERAGFYRELIAHNPKFEKYRNGWLTRAYL